MASLQEVSTHVLARRAHDEGDIRIASIAFGWTLGFSIFVTMRAIRQTIRARRWNTYLVLCWVEILASMTIAVLAYLFITGSIQVSLAFLFIILVCWTFQVQCLFQIIVNRLCILISKNSDRIKLKAVVAVIATTVNISVFVIWIPAKLGVSKTFHDVNEIWDRIGKCIFLLVDGVLNFYFIRTVKKRLVQAGLKKYDKLVRFNTGIVGLNLGMDVLIIGMMSYKNEAVYMAFHPVAYMVKLEIEMAMSDLIVAVARSTGVYVYEGEKSSSGPSGGHVITARDHISTNRGVEVRIATQVHTKGDEYEMADSVVWDRKYDGQSSAPSENGLSVRKPDPDVEPGVRMHRT